MHPIQTQFRRKKTSHIRKGFATFPRLVSLLVRQEDRLNMSKTHSWNSSLAQRREGNYSREGNSFKVILWDRRLARNDRHRKRLNLFPDKGRPLVVVVILTSRSNCPARVARCSTRSARTRWCRWCGADGVEQLACTRIARLGGVYVDQNLGVHRNNLAAMRRGASAQIPWAPRIHV